MADTKPGVLRNLRIKRVALVEQGANFDTSTGDGAHIMLFKADRSKSSPSLGAVHVDKPIELDEKDKKKEKPMSKIAAFVKGLVDAVRETDPTKQEAAVAELEKAFPADLKDEKPVHKSDDAMCKCADCMAKRTTKSADKIEKSAEVVELEKSINSLKEENVALAKTAQSALEIVKAERTERKKGEMTTLLKSFRATPFVVEGADNDVDRFMKMQEADPTGFTRIMAIYKASDAQLAQSALFQSYGSSRVGAGNGTSAYQQLEALANANVSKSLVKISKEQALEDVIMDPANSALVAAYRAEN